MMSSSEEGEDDFWSVLPPPSTGPKMERCMLGKEEILLPEVMIEQSHIFKDVLSVDTWKTVLTSEQRTHLMKFLPKFPENDRREKEITAKKLLEGENFKFGNPLTNLQQKMKDGFCSPDISKYSSLCRSVKYREYKHRQQRRYTNMLKEMLVARQKVFEQLRKIPPDGNLKLEYNPPQPKKSTIETRVKKTYVRLMKEVREECGVEDTSSEEEREDEDNPGISQKSKKQLFSTVCPIPSPEPTIPSVFHTFCAKPAMNGDLGTDGHSSQNKRLRPFSPVEITEDDYKTMLKNHKRQRLEGEEEYPQLDTSNITLEDIMLRCQAIKKSPKHSPVPEEEPAPTLLGTKKKRLKLKEKTEKKLKKSLKDKKSNKDKSLSQFNDDGSVSLSEGFLDEKEDNILDFPLPESYPPKMNFRQHANFFSLLRDFILEFNDGKTTTAKMEEKVREWQESPTSSLNVWYGLHKNWVDCVSQTLKFLAGDLIGVMPENFVPYLDFKDRVQQWRWIGAGRDSDEKMGQLFKHWLTNKKEGSEDASEGGQGSPPPPRVRTSYVVKATTEEEKVLFRDQEATRFENPHKGFTYRMHGYESVVGPVKGVYTKDNSMNKAREHALLVSSRPSYVTILTLVRDSAARLPNGEGTRGDICELLKDSQFLAPGVSDAQLNVVVSGALDRLHSEKDPCVKYDVKRKLWICLHRSRSEEEFERIHQAHGAAQKAKKSLQKPKSSKTPKLKEMTSALTSTPALKSALTGGTDTLSTEELLLQSHTPGSPSVLPRPKTGRSTLKSALTAGSACLSTEELLLQSNTLGSPSVLPRPKTGRSTLKSALTAGSACLSTEELLLQSHTPGSPSVLPRPKTGRSTLKSALTAGSACLSTEELLLQSHTPGSPSVLPRSETGRSTLKSALTAGSACLSTEELLLQSHTPGSPSVLPRSETGRSTLKSALTAGFTCLSRVELLLQSLTLGSPSVHSRPKTAGSPTISQINPRGATGSPRSTANPATLVALKNVVAAAATVTQATTSVSQASATIRLQLQQLQQQQKQAAAVSASVPRLQVPSSPATPAVVTGQGQPQTEIQSVQKTVPLGLLQNIRAANPNMTQANLQTLTSAIRQELLVQRQNSQGVAAGQSSSPTVTQPSSSSPAVTKVMSPLTLTQTLASGVTTAQTTSTNAQLVTRLVQQVSGNQMMSVSSLLAAQRAQAQGSRAASPAIKIQGANLVPTVGGNPVQLAGKPLSQARGQLVQIGGKGSQQVGLIQAPQGGLSTINIIPQGGAAAGVMTLGQPRTPGSTERVESPQNIVVTTNARVSQSAILNANSPKVVTPSQGGIVVTQLTPGLTLRQGAIPTSTQAKIVTAGQAGLLPAQFIVQQTSGGMSTISTTVSQSLAGSVPLLVSSAGKPGQNIQVVRTVLGQQAGIKPGQATILISQPALQSNASVLHTGQVLQNTTKVHTKGVQQNKTQPVFARIINPPPTQKLTSVSAASASGQKLPAQVLQTVNKLITVTTVGKTNSQVPVLATQAQGGASGESDTVMINIETDSEGKS
ncbi:hypothetical protein FSP39_000785 [Pinctada imbricata]|uniref:DEUBAD domain-containing protein n=1 Tax=Pinctada imbricata TaxID=66713 RepID=A0AA88YL88_PINIB|nr:hypothetical protein FSP39_000785 [Pinctada imbricata]